MDVAWVGYVMLRLPCLRALYGAATGADHAARTSKKSERDGNLATKGGLGCKGAEGCLSLLGNARRDARWTMGNGWRKTSTPYKFCTEWGN